MKQKEQPLAVIKGIPAAPGQVYGPAAVFTEASAKVHHEIGKDPRIERARLVEVINLARQEIEGLVTKLTDENHPEEAALFSAHLLLLTDKSLHRKVDQALNQGVNAEAAWSDSVEVFAAQLASLADPTLALRAADLRDVGQKVLNLLAGQPAEKNLQLEVPSIILAKDLSPSETVSLDKSKVLGFATAEGGPTSHTAILAKALGLPAVVGLGNTILNLPAGTPIILNGNTGIITPSPDPVTLAAFEDERSRLEEAGKYQFAQAVLPAITVDGHQIEVVANIGSSEDAKNALAHGAEGVGLLRTEFIFLDRKSPPTPEEQVQIYSQILEIMGTRPVVVRTIDAGGDKEIEYLNLQREANPFLGRRAIRLCLAEPEIFKNQLKALLVASPGHDLRIMFPMVAILEEILEAKEILNQAMKEVQDAGYKFAEHIQVGIMVEIPSAAIMADLFVQEVDFFSIGTNDLTQYALAADRTNQSVSYLSDHCHPAVIRLIDQVVQAAHRTGKWVGVCGEMAGDIDAIPVLLGLGIDELSMSPALIPQAKNVIRKLDTHIAQQVAREVLNLRSAGAVRSHVKKVLAI